jgi:hypothetical protein
MEQHREVIAVLKEILSSDCAASGAFGIVFIECDCMDIGLTTSVCIGFIANMRRHTKKRVMTGSTPPIDHVEELNEVWSLDFMRNTLNDSHAFRTLNVIDEGNREGLRIEIGRSITAARFVRNMRELVEVRADCDPARQRSRTHFVCVYIISRTKRHRISIYPAG